MSEVSATPVPGRRWWWPRRGELSRPVDRIEAALLVGLTIVAFVLLPVGLALGSETYTSRARAGEEQSRTRHPATATLVADAPLAMIGTSGEMITSTSDVAARWTVPGGAERTGSVRVDNGSKAGAVVPIWLDEAGTPVEAPVSRGQAATDGVAVALGFWVLALALLGGLLAAGRAALARYRSAAWQREWARVEPNWTRGA